MPNDCWIISLPQLTEKQKRTVYTRYEKPDWGAQSRFGLMGVFTIPRRHRVESAGFKFIFNNIICLLVHTQTLLSSASNRYTGLFISPSGTSELDCATTKRDTAERSISIGTESLKVFFCTRGLGVLAGSTARG